MSAYFVRLELVRVDGVDADLFRVGFGDPAQNDDIVRDALVALASLGEVHGVLALVNGPASLPVALVLGHHLSHRYGAVAVFDPKLGSYVVAVSHDPFRLVGSLISKELVLTR